MSDKPDWGNDSFPEVPPLTAQEKQIIEGFAAELKRCGDTFDTWLKSVDKKVVKRRIKFSVELGGDDLVKLMFMRHVLLDGYKAMSDSEFVHAVVESGIHWLFDAFSDSALANAMRLQQLMSLPPEIRDAVMTDEFRAMVRGLVEQANSGKSMSELMKIRQPQHKAPKAQQGYQKAGNAPAPQAKSNTVPDGMPTDAFSPMVCSKCGIQVSAKDSVIIDNKVYCQDCGIDAGLAMQRKQKENPDAKNPST